MADTSASNPRSEQSKDQRRDEQAGERREAPDSPAKLGAGPLF